MASECGPVCLVGCGLNLGQGQGQGQGLCVDQRQTGTTEILRTQRRCLEKTDLTENISRVKQCTIYSMDPVPSK